MIDTVGKFFFSIVRAALFDGDRPGCYELSENQWEQLFQVSKQQNLFPVVFDEVTAHPSNLSLKQRTRWALVYTRARNWSRYKHNVLMHLRDLLSEQGVPLMLLKGEGVARLYPKPLLRESGDIDIYSPGNFDRVNEIVRSMGIAVHDSNEKHTEFVFEDVPVENHRKMMEVKNDATRIIVSRLANDLERDPQLDESLPGILLPRPEVFAFHIFAHTLSHFEWMDWSCEGIRVNNIVDLALVLSHYRDSLDWDYFYDSCREAGIMHAASLFAVLSEQYLGCNWMSENYKETVTPEEMDFVMEEIFHPCPSPLKTRNPFRIVARTFKLHYHHFCRYRLIYRESVVVCLAKEISVSFSHLGRFIRKRLCRNYQ